MPNYVARNKKTLKEKSLWLSISEVDDWEKANPNWEIAIGAPIIGYNCYSIKPPDWMRDKVKEIKKANPGSTIKEI